MRAAVATLVLLAILVVGHAQRYQCKGETFRLRKPWSMLTATERARHIAAVGDAMSAGYHHRFVEMHTEPQSEREAHGCMFIYWHRKFLLGYENMLRSLKPEYACLTLPYWDYATLSSSFVSGSCQSMYSCATNLIDSLGGLADSNARRTWYRINGDRIHGIGCVQRPPLDNFCQSTSAFQSKQCMRCVPRGDIASAAVPPETNIVPVFSQILGGASPTTGKTFAEVSSSIQNNAHNTIHNALGSTMATFQSPSDPLFYLHHAEIDLMHRIYFKCVVADTVPGRVPVLSDSAKRSESDTRIWRSCVRYNETTIRSTDPVLMLAGQYNQVKIDVHNPSSPLYEFFKDLPRAYYKYVDGDDLGRFSYRYQYTGMLADMLTKCKRFIAPQTATFLQSAGSPTNPSYVDRCVDRPRLACEVTEQSFLDYMSNVAGERGWSHDHLIAQVEALVCIHHHECLGGCADYSDEFKATFHPMGPPRCKVVVDRWKNGQLHIRVKNWRAILARFFPCAHDAAIANA
ncbi:hypothetical protein H310_11290 [Aphanomyces invadans]|uniref:Tyrosinase copper-binding domain-containing protein n=1 Tax=Aphanomyces invadans TaxID=157072 RepID=A0A024TMR4_9STRA|nr:hypothetical protein H310_11290 [Aphanomyces invadans]ETV95415.1 hypothetical protein H310_11290 [Aphanomyces invadans]|eukprot:XP_008876116.1 hypothetical protein H310_11290 [Aphanomyces invadans]